MGTQVPQVEISDLMMCSSCSCLSAAATGTTICCLLVVLYVAAFFKDENSPVRIFLDPVFGKPCDGGCASREMRPCGDSFQTQQGAPAYAQLHANNTIDYI